MKCRFTFGVYRLAEIGADGPPDGARYRCQVRFSPLPSPSRWPMTVFL